MLSRSRYRRPSTSASTRRGPGDQGPQGSCVGWAVAYTLKSYHERIERGWPLNNNRHVMSPAYVYNQIKQPGGGSYYADAFTLLAVQGVSSWAEMPYNWRDDRSQPSSRARAEAADYKIAEWGTVRRTTHALFVQEVKRHLAAATPVLIAVPVYPDLDNLSERNAVYDDDSGRQRGYHAVVIVGYDDGRSAFKIVNSWGTDWGIGGYGWIDYAASERLIVSAYVTKDVEPEPDNQPPVADDSEVGIEMALELPDYYLTRDAALFFYDPEGQPLTYEVIVDPEGVVSVPFAVDVPEQWTDPDPPPETLFYLNPVAPGSGRNRDNGNRPRWPVCDLLHRHSSLLVACRRAGSERACGARRGRVGGCARPRPGRGGWRLIDPTLPPGLPRPSATFRDRALVSSKPASSRNRVAALRVSKATVTLAILSSRRRTVHHDSSRRSCHGTTGRGRRRFQFSGAHRLPTTAG